jgi:Chromo (CHRromatin Organisation MOdifier) domain
MDFITDLPPSDGFDSILVVVDHGSTKGVILEPCNKTIDAMGTAKILLNSLYKRFGLPDKAISDRGPQFASQAFQELGRLLGIKLAMSTAHHPQTDGATERANQEIEAYLSIFCANHPETWKSHLPTLEFSYNLKPHATQKEAPLFLQMGYNPISIPTAYPVTNIPATQERLLILQEARKEANAAHELARQKMMERITRGFTPFKKGDKVWLESKHLKFRYESKKLAPKREGPFTISEVLSPLNYRLSLPKSWRTHPVFHATLLSPFKNNNVHGENFPQPPPDLIDDLPEYEIEAILSHRRIGRGYQYLIKWKGYSTAENSWEPEKNLEHSKQTLNTYKTRHRLHSRTSRTPL